MPSTIPLEFTGCPSHIFSYDIMDQNSARKRWQGLERVAHTCRFRGVWEAADGPCPNQPVREGHTIVLDAVFSLDGEGRRTVMGIRVSE